MLSFDMSNDYFRFKQFCIRHDRCAMKVGTDGVLLGAWGYVGGKHVLDIGTGTGLIALMAAQRNPSAQVLGIDIDRMAVQQASENILESPFSSRVSCIVQDVLTFEPRIFFDAILCNPPFFTEDTLPHDNGRALARNSSCLPFPKLISKVASLLSEEGTFSVIIPSSSISDFVALCLANNLHLSRRCLVHTTARKPPRRALLSFVRRNPLHVDDCGYCKEQTLCLTDGDGNRSAEYRELTAPFYL